VHFETVNTFLKIFPKEQLGMEFGNLKANKTL
jgi:hypothetical protein